MSDDLRNATPSQLTTGSLFSGYGGLDMATEHVFGARTAWVSDIDKGARKVLAHRYPHAPNLGDIATVNWADVEPVDIITGGSPCQDLSTAGRRAGMTDGTRSNLWVAMREAIAHVQPTFVVWENVRGAVSAEAASDLEHCAGCMGSPDDRGPALRALGRVLGDLADLGFDAEWRGLRASDVGACHQRFRVFVLAWRRDADIADAVGGFGLASRSRTDQWPMAGRDGEGARHGVAMLPTPRTSDTNGAGAHGSGGPDLRTVAAMLPTPRADEGGGNGVAEAGRHSPGLQNIRTHFPNPNQFGQYAPAIARQEAAFGYPAPSPTEPGKNRPRLSARFCEWMMGAPEGWITDVPDVTRNEALKLCGNGVVPQQAAAALRHALSIATNHASEESA